MTVRKKTSRVAARTCLAAFLTVGMLTNVTACGKNRGEAKTLRLSGIEKLNQGDYAGAVEDLDAALQAADGTIGSYDIDVLRYRAEAEYKLEDYQAAAHTYDMLIQIDGESLEYLYLAAISKARSGDPDGALAAYEKAWERKKKKKETTADKNLKPQALTALAEALAQAGREAEVNALYEKLIADGEADSHVLNSYGLSLMEAGQYDQALTVFNQAVALASTESAELAGDAEASGTGDGAASAAFNIAVTYERQSEYKKALEAFQAYVAQYGSTPEAEKEIMFLKTR